MDLDKREYYLIGAFLMALIPLILFALFWWSIASLDILNMMVIPESSIAVFAIAGLATGIFLNVIYLKRWILKFYEMRRALSILLYLICSFMAVAFFMGFPIGNLLLGFLGGVYIGRKYHHLNADNATFSSASQKASIFTASVTSLEALLIGLLVLREESAIDFINRILGFGLFHKNEFIDIAFILILCIILFLTQYYITLSGTKISFNKIEGKK